MLFGVKNKGKTMVSVEKQYEYVTGQLAAQIDRMNTAFKNFVQLFTAIVGGVVWLSLETKVGSTELSVYAQTSTALVCILAAVSIVLIGGNLLSWWNYRRTQALLTADDPDPNLRVPPPKITLSYSVEAAMIGCILIACALFAYYNPLRAKAAELGVATPSLARQWAADWSGKNLDAVMALYAPEPVFLPTVGPRWEGASAIRWNAAGLLARYNPNIVLISRQSRASGNLAFDSGSYDETILPVKGGTPVRAKGNYLFVFQRQADGAWKILQQTFTELEPVKL